MSMKKIIVSASLLLLCVFLCAACGDDNGGSDDTATEDTLSADGQDQQDQPDIPLDQADIPPDQPADTPDEDIQPDPEPDVQEDSQEDVAPDTADAAELPPGFVWVSIPAGAFDMGCSPGDTDCDVDEEPRHTVTVSGFSMTETEITQAQYEWVIGSNPSYFTDCPNCPVEQVDWNEAKAFCEAIGGRLPSEAEWEYAARAGTTTRYYCGNDAACLDGIAWYDENSGSTTHPVGEKTANGFGLHDMLGNVLEWVEDCMHDNYDGAPSTGGVWRGGNCDYRVLRGGSWSDNPWTLRVSYRSRTGPDFGSRYLGFRCAQ